jgi:histidine ammonia-lyase
MHIDGRDITLAGFLAAVDCETQLTVAPKIREHLVTARTHIDAAAAGDTPIYGLNTGLGANLGHRLSPSEITAFQRQTLEGRATAVGPDLPASTGRAVLLYRIISASKGHSGISPDLFDHLVWCFNTGLSPAIPHYGSIGAGDLTQLAPWALQICDTKDAPNLQAKDAMALINHTGLTIALAARAITAAQITLRMAHHALLLTYIGYDANRDVLSAMANALRSANGQATCAQWLHTHLEGTQNNPRRIQEALSIRTAHTTLGAAQHATDQAAAALEIELNATSDSPALLPDGTLTSTANFHTPALALALDTVTLALTRVANDSLQRTQRLMNPDLTALPKYLSPKGGASAGFIPVQKTTASLLADIYHQATPIPPPAPVSDSVEDVAPMTPQSATKLHTLTAPLKLLLSIEARTALQAIHLRDPKLGPPADRIVKTLTNELPLLTEDRALGPEIEKAARLLERL